MEATTHHPHLSTQLEQRNIKTIIIIKPMVDNLDYVVGMVYTVVCGY